MGAPVKQTESHADLDSSASLGRSSRAGAIATEPGQRVHQDSGQEWLRNLRNRAMRRWSADRKPGMHKFIRGTNDLPAHTGDIYWMESLAGRRRLQLNEEVGMGTEVLRMRRQQRPEGQAALAAEYRHGGKIAQAGAA